MKLEDWKNVAIEVLPTSQVVDGTYSICDESKRYIVIARAIEVPKRGTDCHLFWTNDEGMEEEAFVYASRVRRAGTNLYIIPDGPRRTFIVKVTRPKRINKF